MASDTRSDILRYGVSLLVAVVAIALTATSSLAAGAPFLLLVTAILICTWFGGLGPGLLATALTSVGALYFVIPPSNSFGISTWDDALRFGLFLLSAVLTTVITAQRDQARKTAQAQSHRQEILAKLGQRALQSQDLPELLATVPPLLAQVLDVGDSYVAETLPDGAALRVVAGVGWKAGIVGRAQLSEDKDSMAGYTLLTQAPVIATDLGAETRFTPAAILVDHGIASGMTVMIRGLEKPFGILGAFTDRRRIFTAADIQFLQAIAHTLVAAIQRHQGEATARRQVEQALHFAEQRYHEASQDLERQAVDLQVANHELEAFTYSVSHDLRAPLATIDQFARLLSEDYGAELPEPGHNYLRLIREATDGMDCLIQDLLDLSRATRQPLQKKTIQPNDLVRQVVEQLRTDQPRRNVEIVLGELPVCEADPVLLKQVWVNLLSNAFKFTRRREVARIEIGAFCEDAAIVYFVKDNGAGFDMAQAGKLFGVFQRLHGEEDYEGTGVGLATVQRIVHRHGGRIWASAEVEKGAAFYFTLSKSESTSKPIE